MKRKKIYTGTLALALAIGVVSPVKNNEFSSVAYAADSQTSPNNEDSEETVPTDKEDSTNTGSQSEEQTKENQKLNDLKKLTAEEADVKKSTRYINASSAEQNAYTSAIAAGENVKADTDESTINGLINNINNAKESLGASSFDTYEQREGLSSTIAIAEKLSASIAGNANVKKEDKDKLTDAIKVAKADEKDVNKSKEEIITSNNNLAQTINDIIKSNNLDANNSALTYDEFEKITPSDNATYGRAYIRLGELINSVNKFSKTDSYKKLNPDIQTNLTSVSTQAAEVYNNLNSDTSKLNDAYSNLSKAYNSALEKSNTANTEVSRLRKQIEETTSKNPDAYENAGDSAKLTYDIAKARANELIAKDSTDAADLQQALNNLNLAKLALAPVKTKTIDNNQPKTSKQALQELINEAESYRNKDLYKLASDEDKKLYNNAITTAQAIVKKANPTDKEINAAIDTIKEIKDSIEKNGPNQKETDNEKLNRLIDDANTAINHPNYKNIAQQNRDDLEKALKKAQKAKKTANKDEILSAISDLEAAVNNSDIQKLLADSIKLKSIKSLEELLELAIKVQAHPDYEDVSNTQSKNLNEAMAAARKALKSGNETDIENARTFLTNQLDQSEIKAIVAKVIDTLDSEESSNLEELRQLLDLANKVKEHKDYKNVDISLKDELENSIEKAKLAIQSKDETKIKQAKLALEDTLDKFDDIKKDILKNDKSPKEKIEEIISGDKVLRSSVTYKKAQKSLREAYEKAFEAAKAIVNKDDASDDELKTASDNLVKALNALDGNEFADRVEKLKQKYQKEGSNITDANKKAAVEAKIKILDDENATMDNLLEAESELTNALKLNGSSTPVTTTTTTTTPVTGTTTTTTPVTTTRKVPTTINPGSIVRTGIKSLVGVAVVLVVALGAFALTGKNKNNKDKTKRRDNNEI